MSALVHGPGEGEVVRVGPTPVVIKATGEHTGGRFFLSETTLAAGMPGPPPHTHETVCDMFHVLEGRLTMRVDDDEIEATAGTFVCAPPGTVHGFRNTSDAPARFLNFNVPAGWEDYMRELAAASASPDGLTHAEFGRIASRYDITWA